MKAWGATLLVLVLFVGLLVLGSWVVRSVQDAYATQLVTQTAH